MRTSNNPAAQSAMAAFPRDCPTDGAYSAFLKRVLSQMKRAAKVQASAAAASGNSGRAALAPPESRDREASGFAIAGRDALLMGMAADTGESSLGPPP